LPHKTKKEMAAITVLSLCRVQALLKEYEETGKISKPKLRGRKIVEKKILSPEQERV
jgi:hypothetical protein